MQNTANEASTGTSEKQPPANKAGGNRSADEVGVLSVKHWSDSLFSFKVERPDSLRFRSGEFVMLGLMAEGATAPEGWRFNNSEATASGHADSRCFIAR